MIITALITLAVLLRIFSNPLANVFQKQLSEKGIHPIFFNFLSWLFLAFGCVMTMTFITWPELSQKFWIYAIICGIVGAFGNGFLVKAIEKGELSVLGPINSYKAIVGIIGGIILLGEIPNFWGLLGIALIIFGSYFVLDTTEERFSLALLKRRDIQYRLWALILTAIEAVFIKKVIIETSVTFAFISWCCFGAVFSFLMLFIYRVEIKNESQKIDYKIIRKILALVVCIAIMQYSTNFIFDHMSVGYALSLFQLSVIVSVLFGNRFFNEQDIPKKLTGSAIMIIGSVLIIFMKQ
jgi:drug/metabolite transporter (DMT)-like permease